VNLQSLLTEHGVPFVEGGSHRHVREGWIGLDCCWCGTTGRWHLGVHLGTLSASCWRCGRHDLTSVLARLFGVDRGRAWSLVKDLPKTRGISRWAGLVKGKLRLPPGLEPLTGAHRRYLLGRGFDPDLLVRLWGLQGLGPLAGRLSWRLWIPVHLDGEVVSWTTRAIGDGDRRYISASPEDEAWPIKSTLYGWDYVRHAVIVCEGPADAWRVGPGAVATHGLAVSSSQLKLLASVPRRIVCFDNSPVAQRTADGLCEQLRCFPVPGETIRVEIDADDPGSASMREVVKLRRFLE